MRLFIDNRENQIRLVGNNKKSPLLVIPVKGLQRDSGRELENYRIQGLVQAEKEAGDGQNNAVSHENVVPCVPAVSLGNKNRDKIGAAGGGVGIKAQGDGQRVNGSAENRRKQGVVKLDKFNEHGRHRVGKHACNKNGKHGIEGKFLPDKLKTNRRGNRV